MNVTLKMKIQDQDFDLVLNLTNRAARIYRQYFQRDLLDDLSELYSKTSVSSGLRKELLKEIDLSKVDTDNITEERLAEQILKQVDVQKLLSNRELKPLNFADSERACRIVWSFVKNADEKTEAYEEWADSFDFVLPVEEIIPAVYNAWMKSARPIVEIKN